MQAPFTKTPACQAGLSLCPALELIQQLQKECRRLWDLSQTDPLTGLYNRRYLMYALEREMERTRRTGLPTSLILIDLDHFKRINDTYGHQTGDLVLQEISRSFLGAIRKLDVVCRYGGEEFAILLPGTRLPHAVRLAERLQAMLETTIIQNDGLSLSVTASFGVDSFSAKEKTSVSAFVKKTDHLLLKAKRQGRNNVQHPLGATLTPTVEVTPAERLAMFPKKGKYEQHDSKNPPENILPDQR